ncbi:MAG: hypothetical protein KAH00_00265 [Cocleimonas sp.]|nr:hypothetical protein [Cocleimonas sp.]
MINKNIPPLQSTCAGCSAPKLSTTEGGFSQLSSTGHIIPADTSKNLTQVIQNLSKQLGDQQFHPPIPPHQEDFLQQPKSKGASGAQGQQGKLIGANKDQRDRPIIKGTSDNDNLKGTHHDEEIIGLAGNDKIYGRQGDDLLFGNEGHDKLYGGQGNDVLKGGSGNDYLAGGRGNNHLFGGMGDDTLNSRLGSDILEGGKGNDTARVRASIDDFNISATFYAVLDDRHENSTAPSEARQGSAILLTHKETGQTIETREIEKFRFDDVKLSLAEMIERATPTDNPEAEKLNINSEQKLNLSDLFLSKPSNSRFAILDKDGDKTVSVGDVAVLSGGASEAELTRKILTRLDVDKINTVNDLELRLDLAGKLVNISGTATADDLPPVINELAKLPTEALQRMVDEGSNVFVVRDSIVEHYPELSGVRPRGWPPGSTWDTVPGVARTGANEMVVATVSGDAGERAIPAKGTNHGSYNLVIHEAAHLYSGLTGGHRSDDFIVARNKEIEAGHLTIPYLLQEGNAGRSETFAGVAAMFYGGSGQVLNELTALFDYMRANVGERHATVPTVSILGNELDLDSNQQKAMLASTFSSQNTQNEFVRLFDTNKDGEISQGDIAARFVVNDGEITGQGRVAIS